MNRDTLPQWDKVSQLISDALADEELLKRLQHGSTEDVNNVLMEYGFTEEENYQLEKDLKTLTDSAAFIRFWI